MKNLDPMMDLVFKALFGKEDRASKELLIAFLNDILENEEKEKIIDVSHLNPFNYKEFEGDKLSILDIKAKTGIGEIINIEVQVRKEDNYRKRSLYYWAKSYGETILESETYDNLQKTIVINILGYIEIVESNKLHTIFKIMEEEEYFELVEDLEIHYLELPKLSKDKVEELDRVELWIEFLKEAGKEGNDKRLEKLMERSDDMKKAINRLGEISADEKMRELYRAREKSRLDMISKLKYAENKGLEKGIEKGIEKGRKEGLEKGREEEKKELARSLLKDGMEVALVAKYTKLSLEEIEKIKNNLENK